MNQKLLIAVLLLVSVAFKSNSQPVDFSLNQTSIDAQKSEEKERGVLSNWTIDQWENYFKVIAPGSSPDVADFGYKTYEKYTSSGKKLGIIRLSNDTITKAKYEIVSGAFKSGIVVSSNGKSGFVDTTGKLVVPIQYDAFRDFDNKTGFVMNNGKYALVDYAGKFLTGFIFDGTSSFFENICKVLVNGKLGYINRTGQYVIQPTYTFNKKNKEPSDYFYGFAVLYSNVFDLMRKEQTVINRKTVDVNLGLEKIAPILINKSGIKIFTGKGDDDISISENGYATIGRNIYNNGSHYFEQQLIDNNGKIIIPFDRDLWISDISKDWIIVQSVTTKNIGLVNFKGGEIIKPTFSFITGLMFRNNDLAQAYFDDDHFMYIDKSGKCVAYDGVACPEKE